MTVIDKTDTPRIYIASLSDYNAGILHGAWIDALDEDDMAEQVQAILATSPTAKSEGLPAEEWAIHDFEGFGPIRVSEWESLEQIARLANMLEWHGTAFGIWYENDSYTADEDLAAQFDDQYLGCYDSPEDWAYYWWKDTGLLAEVPKDLQDYIDFKAYARDCQMGGDIWICQHALDECYVYSNH